MAAQRIVLTSPWKLGLFVFMLVAGTGFGLIYAYIEIFGGQVDLRDEKVLQTAYIVLGAVAALGLLGYIAVVSSARPLDRVVRNSRNREQLLKKFGKIQDPRMVDIDDFEDEPALKVVLERWGEQAAAASDARLSSVAQSEALAALTAQIRESDADDFHPDLHDSSPDLDALVDAIKGFATTTGSAAASGSFTAVGAVPADGDWSAERATWHEAASQLFLCEQELEGFVRSVSDHASEVASRTGHLSQHSGSLPREAAMSVENLRRNGARMGKIRDASTLLAEEANKLSVAMGVSLSRNGNQDGELAQIAESLRTLATQYQRIAAEVDTACGEQEVALDSLMGLEVTTLDSTAAHALAQQAMALDQHAEALNELLGRFQNPMAQIRDLAPQIAAAVPPPAAQQFRTPTPAPAPAPVEEVRAQESAPIVEPTPVEQPAAQPEAERVYEIADLGGRELAAGASAGGEDRVYELDELGAKEL